MEKKMGYFKYKRYKILKAQLAEASRSFWQQKALEMFVFPHTDEGFTICGEKCTKKEAIKSFEKHSGYTLNELGVKAHD